MLRCFWPPYLYDVNTVDRHTGHKAQRLQLHHVLESDELRSVRWAPCLKLLCQRLVWRCVSLPVLRRDEGRFTL